MKGKSFRNLCTWVPVYVLIGLTQLALAQMEAPALVPTPLITAEAGKPANISCESYGNPISLCIWEKFNTDKTKPSTLISFMQGGQNTTGLPGYFLYGELQSGICGLHAVNITRQDMSKWQCTLFSDVNVFRGLVDLNVVNKPEPPKFIPSDLGNLVDGETIGSGGSALACYSAYGLPPPTFKWFLGDEPYTGALFPVNSTEDAEGNTYTFQQLKNQHFTWRENGKSIRCLIEHHMITENDTSEATIPINVRYKPRAEQNSLNVFVQELGHPSTNLTYIFYANPKPRIYWEVDGVRISAGFFSPDRRMEALVLEEAGPSSYAAVLKVRDMKRADLRRKYILKTENNIGRQDFEICITQNLSRQGATCASQALFVQVKAPATQAPPKDESEETDSDGEQDAPPQVKQVLHMLGEVHHQMLLLREQEAHLQNQLLRMKSAKKVDEQEGETTESVVLTSTPAATKSPEEDKTRGSRQFRLQQPVPMLKPIRSSNRAATLDTSEFSEVKVESAGIFIRRKNP